MPYRSEAQRKYFHAYKKVLETRELPKRVKN